MQCSYKIITREQDNKKVSCLLNKLKFNNKRINKSMHNNYIEK